MASEFSALALRRWNGWEDREFEALVQIRREITGGSAPDEAVRNVLNGLGDFVGRRTRERVRRAVEEMVEEA